ncbi:dentin sialophosphoprotein-like [Nilaparvata lugens]|uniref:dentin sialophosphoprotein-like n=1 Tax=Nilaparvata lugens TaxID=108931 RepID=UPI00193D8B65|nr:dentin sialophosphoprotein-like [Nilaparvata lugens]
MSNDLDTSFPNTTTYADYGTFEIKENPNNESEIFSKCNNAIDMDWDGISDITKQKEQIGEVSNKDDGIISMNDDVGTFPNTTSYADDEIFERNENPNTESKIFSKCDNAIDMAYDDISNTEQKEQIAQNTIDSQSDTDSMEYYESDSYVPSSESSDDGDGEVTSSNLKRLSSESPKKHNDRPITMDNDEDNFPNTTCDADSVIEMNINPNNESETVVNVENASDRADNDITGPEEQISELDFEI